MKYHIVAWSVLLTGYYALYVENNVKLSLIYFSVSSILFIGLVIKTLFKKGE